MRFRLSFNFHLQYYFVRPLFWFISNCFLCHDFSFWFCFSASILYYILKFIMQLLLCIYGWSFKYYIFIIFGCGGVVLFVSLTKTPSILRKSISRFLFYIQYWNLNFHFIILYYDSNIFFIYLLSSKSPLLYHVHNGAVTVITSSHWPIAPIILLYIFTFIS